VEVDYNSSDKHKLMIIQKERVNIVGIAPIPIPSPLISVFGLLYKKPPMLSAPIEFPGPPFQYSSKASRKNVVTFSYSTHSIIFE